MTVLSRIFSIKKIKQSNGQESCLSGTFFTVLNGVFLIILLSGLFVISGCSYFGQKKENAQAGKKPKAPPVVVVAAAIKKTVPITGDYAAKIDPANGAETVEIRARVDAVLLEQHFEEGEPVKKGQLLFTLDAKPFEANLRLAEASLEKAMADQDQAKNTVSIKMSEANLISAKAQLELARINAARLKPLMEKKAVPRQDYDNAVTIEKVARANVAEKKAAYGNSVLNKKVTIRQSDAAIESANAQINKANIDISYCYIRSPISGFAGKRRVSPGNLVGQGEATLLTTITSLDPLRINFSISEADYLTLQKNSLNGKYSKESSENLTLILSDGSKYPHKGKIIIQDPTLDPKTNTLNITALFPNPQKLLRPGMFGRIRMVTDYRENSVLIPQKAVMVIQDVQYCYVVTKDNKVEMRNLILEDHQAGKMAIVKEGLKPGERVIVEGQMKARPDMTVKIADHPVVGERGGK
jgi:membrane fusion protein (multidrug efflux system)